MSVTRRLTTVFYADVAGYSRLTGADEEGSHQRVMAVLDDVTARITDAGGEVLRYAGDAVLAVFPSVVLAVETSAAIQTSLAERAADLAEDQRVLIRIGINLGDVIEDRGEVYGEGVNLAARLEAAAEPGGLCLSDDAYRQCRKHVALEFTDGGEERFKNIDEAVQVWRWSPGIPAAGSENTDDESRRKPSIAVLPFNNMSGDPEQEYFSDGITEDIITELSRFRSLLVIARNSSFIFKGKAVDVREAGRTLAADYVVEGSVRKAGNRVRVTAQLIEAATGNHLWAERFDHDLEDIFAVQDNVVAAIVAALPVRIERTRAERSRHTSIGNLPTYDLILRGRWHIQDYRNDSPRRAEEAYARAIALDPDNTLAHAGLATACIHSYFWDAQAGFLARAIDHAQRAVALDRDEPAALDALALALTKSSRSDEAIPLMRRAVELLPGSMHERSMLGISLVHNGRHEEAQAHLERAVALDPHVGDWTLEFLGQTYYFTHRFAEAAATFGRIVDPPSWVCGYHAAACAMNGDTVAARELVANYSRLLKRE
jgi:adenylate cyclase